MPVDPVSLGLLSAGNITEANYLAIAAKYNAEVKHLYLQRAFLVNHIRAMVLKGQIP